MEKRGLSTEFEHDLTGCSEPQYKIFIFLSFPSALFVRWLLGYPAKHISTRNYKTRHYAAPRQLMLQKVCDITSFRLKALNVRSTSN